MNFPRQIVRKVGIVLAALAALGALSTVGMMSKAETRPSRVSIAVEPHGSVLAVMSATVNSLPLFEWSLRGRTETRGPDYPGPDAATLAVELMWYDIPADRYYQHAFQLDARDLSTFGDRTDHAEVRIVIGPGADITVTTPHPEALRLVGLNRMDEITPEMDVDVVIAELCATLSAEDPSADKDLRMAMGDEIAVGEAVFNRENWLSGNAAPAPRCPAEDGQ
ncbi:hypothetical protein [Pseudoxanthomonas mexicana]